MAYREDWVPENSEDQFKMGLKLINNAYCARQKVLEKELATLTARVQELSIQLRESNDRALECELQLADLNDKHTQLVDEHEQMLATSAKLKEENTILDNAQNRAKSTFVESFSPSIPPSSAPSAPSVPAPVPPAAPSSDPTSLSDSLSIFPMISL